MGEVHGRRTLALLAAALSISSASGASVFWEPYGYDTATVALFPCDAAARPADSDAALDDLLTGGAPAALPALPGAAPSDRALANAHPIGPAASLTGDAAQVEAGRFNGGVRLANPAAAIGFRGGSARGTTEFWLKAEALPAEPTPVLHWRSAADAAGLSLLLHPDGTLEPRLGDDSFGRTSWRLGPGRWTHLALSADWAFEFSGLLRLHADGVPLLEAEPRWDYRVANRLAALNELRVGGVSGWLDELRISKSVRAYYPYDLGWEDVANERPPAVGRPFCRNPADLALRLGFDKRLDADPAPPGLAVSDTGLRVKGLGESKASRGFGDGVCADALLLGPDMPQPAYAAPALLSSEAGTVAFWLRPLNWDNFTRVDHRREASRVRRLTLFRVFGQKPAPIRKFGPMRGNDPSLLALLIDITPDADQAAPPSLHPGVWNHIAITWQGTSKRLFINGRPCAFAGIQAATHGWWRENGEQVQGEIFAGSVPDRLAFDGRTGDARTLLDDFRLYNRPLSPPEAANLARAPDHRQEPLPLPDLYAAFQFNGAEGTAAAHATPLLPAYGQVTRFALTLLRQGEAKPLGTTETPCPADGGLTALTLKTAPFGFGAYRLRLDALDATGAILATTNHPFARVQPPWWQTDAGRSDAVMPGWTPLVVADDTLRVTGREIRLGPSGLPASIRSAGGELLAAPVTLLAAAGGTPLPLTPQAPPVLNRESERRATARATLTGAGVTVRTALEADFDGMLWYTLTLEATDAARPPALDQLELRIPLKSDNAELCHWSSAQRDFRDPAVNWIGELPPVDGVLLRSNDFARWRRVDGLRGSFIPYVLLTGMARGLSWFAENDRGWTQHDHVPAVSVERDGDTVTLVLRIVAQPLTLDTPRVIAFGLHPTPFKALDPDWRRCPAWDGTTPDTFAGNNLKGGPDTVFWLYPEHGDWEAVRRRLDGEGATQRIVSRAASHNAAFSARYGRPPRPRESHVPALYWDMQWVGGFPNHTREWASRWHPDFTYYLPEFIDFSVWAWREWIRNTGKTVAGIYLDDCWPIPSKLDWSPVTHTLADGHVQPGWQWRGWRERMMRTRQVFHDEGLPPKFCAHTTHTHFAPYHSFFDYFLDGEDHYASPPGQRDFIDSWPLARLRFAHAAKWGVATGWLGWCGNSTPTEKYPAWTFRQQRAYTALIALHDIAWPFADGIEARFNLREPDTVFAPYWEDDGPARHDHADLKVAAWRRPGQCLVLLVNLGPERLEAEVRLNPAAMGFTGDAGALQAADVDASLLTYFAEDATTVKPPAIGDDPLAAKALDLERDPDAIPLAERRAADPDGRFEWRDGLLRCPVRRHDYRLFLFQ